VGLVALALEGAGITTVALQLLHAAIAEVRPPRSLWIPFWDGRPLGAPNDPEYLRAVLEAAFEMLEDASLTPPALRDYSTRA
jgi:hypothetical protein